jgi:hypothetical protein
MLKQARSQIVQTLDVRRQTLARKEIKKQSADNSFSKSDKGFAKV